MTVFFLFLTGGLFDELQGELVEKSLVLHGPIDDALHKSHVVLVGRVLRQLVCGRTNQDHVRKVGQ